MQFIKESQNLRELLFNVELNDSSENAVYFSEKHDALIYLNLVTNAFSHDLLKTCFSVGVLPMYRNEAGKLAAYSNPDTDREVLLDLFGDKNISKIWYHLPATDNENSILTHMNNYCLFVSLVYSKQAVTLPPEAKMELLKNGYALYQMEEKA